MAKAFEVSVSDFADLTENRMLAVFKESAQDVLEEAQTPVAKGGRMPVDTSFLRNSLVSGLNGSFSNSGPESYVATIVELELGDVAKFGWTAEYAEHQEYGTKYMTGKFYAGSAVARWPEFVKRNAAKATSK